MSDLPKPARRAISFEQLSTEAGVSRVAVVNAEAGHYSTGIGSMIDIARALGVSLARLLDEAGVDPGDDD